MANTPLIRDTLTIDDTVQAYYNAFTGDGPVFLLGRKVQHKPAYTLKLGTRPVVIVADEYDGNGGSIDGSGRLKNPADPRRGADGVNGADCSYRKVAVRGQGGLHPTTTYKLVPTSAGKPGTAGGDGSSGSPGTDVTLLCRSGVNVRIDVSATGSAPGGNGGNGGKGGEGEPGRTYADGTEAAGFPGTPGGNGGKGGNGGSGASGGRLTIFSTTPIASPALKTGGTSGSPGGTGGRGGHNGSYISEPEDGSGAPQSYNGAHGAQGADGASPASVVQVLAEEDYKQHLRDLLKQDSQGRNFGNFWAPFRLNMGEFHFRRFQPEDDSNTHGILAAREFAAARELQDDNQEVRRFQALLVGGATALGLPRDQDVVPDFRRYSDQYNSIAALVTAFFNQGLSNIIAAQQLDAIKTLLTAQKKVAEDAVQSIKDDLAYAQQESKNAADEVPYLEQQLAQANADIQKSMEAMKKQSFNLLGTVAEVGAAVVGVIAAIPTGGASLVAVVPAVISLASTVIKDTPPAVNALLDGSKPNVDDVEKAYKKVGEKVQAFISAGQKVVDFVKLVQKIGEASTPENAESVALVRRGAELAHQVLLAKNNVALGGMKVQAFQARLGRAQGILDYIQNAGQVNAGSIRAAGQTALNAALLQVDTLQTMAFLAQRSYEIYTLGPRRTPLFDLGSPDPDKVRAYQDGLPGSEAAMVQAYQASWNMLLQPIALQNAYTSYLQHNIQTDIVRFSFTAEADAALLQQLRDTGVMPFRVDVNALTQNARETKIRGVAVALVGASSPSGLVSCDVWHGTRYEQIGPDNQPAPQFLEAKSYTLQAPVTPLTVAPVHFGADEAIDAPGTLPLWGRGAGGEWNLRLPKLQPHGEFVDLGGLKTVQIWIGYQYVPMA